QLAGRKEITFGDTTETGVYRVQVETRDRELEPRPALDFAINLDPKESDYAKARAPRPDAMHATAPQATTERPTRRIELWHGIAAALLLLLLAEGALSGRS